MKRWEYSYVFSDWRRHPDQTMRDLNNLGREGWNICGVEAGSDEELGVILLKRELAAPEQKE